MSKSPKWYVQVFRNKNGTNHLKDIIIEAPSAEEAKKIAKRKLPEGQHFYAAEYKADTLDAIADSLRRVADGVDGLERRLNDEWSEEARKAAAEARKKGGKKGSSEEETRRKVNLENARKNYLDAHLWAKRFREKGDEKEAKKHEAEAERYKAEIEQLMK